MILGNPGVQTPGFLYVCPLQGRGLLLPDGSIIEEAGGVG